MTSKQQVKSIQKMVYNKDSNLNSNGDASIIGLFKSTSSLSRSLRQQCHIRDLKEDLNYSKTNYDNNSKNKNSLSVSGKMIMDSKNLNSAFNKIQNNFPGSHNVTNVINQNSQNNSYISNLNFNFAQDENNQKFVNKVQSNPPKSMRNNIEIRNLTHFYDKIESHQETYELLFLLKSDKRMRHLDRLDDYENLKVNFLNSLDDKIKRKFDVLQAKLKTSKTEIDNQLTKSDEELINMLLRDIEYTQIIHRNIINSRQDEINNSIKIVDQFNQDSLVTIDNYIIQLKKDLIDIGFMLDSEIEEICSDKKREKEKYFANKRMECIDNFESIKTEEISLVEESKNNLQHFILRWKNVKLKRNVKDLKDILSSKEFVDNSDRYELIKNLKKDQENIYTERCNLILNKMLKMSTEDITIKAIEGINKELDDIYNNAQNLFDMHTQKLMSNSEQIFQNSLKEVEKFKEKIKKISYEFGKDNKDIEIFIENKEGDVKSNKEPEIITPIQDLKNSTNTKGNTPIVSLKGPSALKPSDIQNNLIPTIGEKPKSPTVLIIKLGFLVEEYKPLTSIEELIEIEINPLLENYKNDRKNYISKIISHLDDYDEYINNNCVKLVNTMLAIGTKNDMHKKNLIDKEKKYMLEMAKAADHNDDIIFEKEEILKKLSSEMKESFHKEDLDSKLEASFNIINELEVEYRDYFATMENLLNSHESKISEDYHLYEIEILNIFGIRGKEKFEEINLRRTIESEFLSKLREQEIAQAELREQEELKKLGGKASAPAQKKKPTPKPKKGEVIPNLIPIRPIESYTSVMGHEYLIDFTIPQLVKSTLRNIIYNREDDTLGNIQKTTQNTNNANVININFNSVMTPSGREKVQDQKINSIPSGNNTQNTGFIDNFNPYEAPTEKEFFSPISDQGKKLLSEENIFVENFLIDIYTKIFNKLMDRMKEDLCNFTENAKLSDNEKREELLTELDIRLKSLAPRKGKIEVEEYDKRLNEIEKHKEKYSQHLQHINLRNRQDNDDCNNLIGEISKEFDELNSLFEKLSKVMEEENNLKSLDDKFKKFKSSYYDLQTNLQEGEIKLVTYTKNNPELLINLNKNFLMTLQSFEKGGTYSENEMNYYKEQIDALNEGVIKKDMFERESLNQNKIMQIKTNLASAYEKMEKKYQSVNENIQAKESVGKKFGSPKRLANDIIINIKMKCNQAQEGLDNLFNKMNNLVLTYGGKKNYEDYLLEDLLALEIRKIIIAVNNCVFNYGKYISAFKPELNYNLIRINLNELAENTELTTKEEYDEDEKRKIEELEYLGYLSKFINAPINLDAKNNKDKENIISFISELNGIDDKVKADCSRIYIGEYSKLINNPEKIPPSLNNFLQNLKFEMESFRLKCVRDLRTFSQKIFNFSCGFIPNIIFEFIYKNTQLKNRLFRNKVELNFKKIEENSEKTKQDIYNQLGPYLANPYYNEFLVKIENNEELRSKSFLDEINKNQIYILENEEKIADVFYKRIINNFEALTLILDNFIYEEEYISLDDEEYFKERKDYNTLLKLKPDNRGNLNLDSKRTFKKIYAGLNRNLLKVNYFEKYQNFIVNNSIVGNDEEKVRMLKNEYIKDTSSKNIIALKLQTNKNLFYYRNNYFDEYCKIFKGNINNIFEKFDKIRQNELDYKKRFYEILKSLKNL